MGLADPFARRLSRNTNLILLEESHLAKVIDPVAGAGGYETLTNGLVTEGWNEFQRIEAEGGIVSSLTLGTLQARVAAKRISREELFVQQKSVMVGVNSFLNDDEKSISVLAPTPTLSKNTVSEFTPLFPGRLSEAFESNHVQEGREP
jgi:methylmalonyl-CoA mutase